MDWQGMRPYADNPKIRDLNRAIVAGTIGPQGWISSDLRLHGPGGSVHILIDEIEALGPVGGGGRGH